MAQQEITVKALKKTRPLNKYCDLMKIVRFCSRLIGVDILDENYKFSVITGFVVFAVIIYYLFTLLTVIKVLADDWTGIFEVFPPLSCCTQGLAKLISAIKYARMYSNLNKTLEGIYEEYQDKGERYERKLLECLDQMKKILAIVGGLYAIVATIIIIIPLTLILYNGKRYMVLVCYVPGLDIDTNQGFIATNCFNSVCVLIAAFGLYVGDLLLLTFLTHSIFFFDIFALKVEDLRVLVEANGKDERIPEALIDIVEWHKFYLRFNEDCNHIFYWTIAVHMLCTTLGILSTLLIILIKDWPGAYAYLVVSFVWLYMYSILGTRIEICNDEFCKEIYNINWYQLAVRERKITRLMLMKSQLPRNIDIVGVMPLTVNTALMITRTIYSFLMVLLKMWA